MCLELKCFRGSWTAANIALYSYWKLSFFRIWFDYVSTHLIYTNIYLDICIGVRKKCHPNKIVKDTNKKKRKKWKKKIGICTLQKKEKIVHVVFNTGRMTHLNTKLYVELCDFSAIEKYVSFYSDINKMWMCVNKQRKSTQNILMVFMYGPYPTTTTTISPTSHMCAYLHNVYVHYMYYMQFELRHHKYATHIVRATAIDFILPFSFLTYSY